MNNDNDMRGGLQTVSDEERRLVSKAWDDYLKQVAMGIEPFGVGGADPAACITLGYTPELVRRRQEKPLCQ